MQRRRFLQMVGIGAAALSGDFPASGRAGESGASADRPAHYAAWLAARHTHVLKAESLDAFLRQPPSNQWAKFDSQLGYVPKDCIQRDGIDGSHSVYRYGPAGERKVINYADRPCRVNTYGNSFTHCHQVSDGETWQEHLAAHLGEPIRNFGVGGYGVFQAFCRLRRVEQTGAKAPCLIFNIFDDDHERSLMPWRHFITDWSGPVEMVHGMPWTHLRVNLVSGDWEEVPSPCPTPEALRNLLSFERAYALTADSEIVQLRAMKEGVPDVPRERIKKLAEWANLKFDFSDAATRRESAAKLVEIVARRSTLHVMEKLRQLALQNGQILMVLFSWSMGAVHRACSGEPINPFDVELLQWLKDNHIVHVDSLDAHKEDFKQFRLTPSAYVARYYHGHYSPKGNQFFAYAVKNAVVEWLDPKPIAYRPGGTIIDFRDGKYLQKPPGAGLGNDCVGRPMTSP